MGTIWILNIHDIVFSAPIPKYGHDTIWTKIFRTLYVLHPNIWSVAARRLLFGVQMCELIHAWVWEKDVESGWCIYLGNEQDYHRKGPTQANIQDWWNQIKKCTPVIETWLSRPRRGQGLTRSRRQSRRDIQRRCGSEKPGCWSPVMGMIKGWKWGRVIF